MSLFLDSDFEFDVELKSQEELHALMDELKEKFPQKIRHWFYFKALKVYKYSYLPEGVI